MVAEENFVNILWSKLSIEWQGSEEKGVGVHLLLGKVLNTKSFIVIRILDMLKAFDIGG